RAPRPSKRSGSRSSRAADPLPRASRRTRLLAGAQVSHERQDGPQVAPASIALLGRCFGICVARVRMPPLAPRRFPMARTLETTTFLLAFVLAPHLVHAGGGSSACPPDAVRVGTACVDKYEASLWRIDPASKLAKRALQGRATLADLQAAGARAVNT